MKVNGQTLLRDVCRQLDINLTMLIAKTSIWANPDVIKELQKENNTALWFKNCRRLKAPERRRTYDEDGCFLDDNSLANRAIKKATGEITEQGTFTACHIYEISCYNSDYHTSISNLVLIPKEICSLTDNDNDVINALKYRSFELYGFFINEQPVKPDGYDTLEWRNPEPYSDKIHKSIKKRKPKF